MKKEERSDRLTMPATPDVVRQICTAGTPTAAADVVAKYPFEDAICIIDNLDQLTAAFIITIFRARTAGSHSDFIGARNYAESLVARADELQIRGTLGLCYARDRVYQEAGLLVQA